MKKIALFLLLISVLSTTAFSQKKAEKDAWMLQPIVKLDDYNPILESDDKAKFFCPVRKQMLKWEEKDVFNPAAIVKDGWVWMFYRAEDMIGKHAGTSRIGLAKSRDGIQFQKNPIPVLYPDNDSLKIFEWEGGCEDPRIVKRDDSTYLMTYTAYDGQTARLCVATSENMMVWQKHGLAFAAEKHRNLWSKSGAIVCEQVESDIVAKKIKDKYWMYWGDTDIFLATSDDLIHWTPVEDKKGKLVSVLKPRPGHFDSKLVEPGPFALLRPQGILLLYNSANDAATGDKSLPNMTYSVGQALFSAEKPQKLTERANRHSLTPERDYEKTGQVNNVCVLEGMVWHKDRWLLYYGTADSKIAMAECKE
jgi:predicted GH43/DUF377 family glycosyl hydrolase